MKELMEELEGQIAIINYLSSCENRPGLVGILQAVATNLEFIKEELHSPLSHPSLPLDKQTKPLQEFPCTKPC